MRTPLARMAADVPFPAFPAPPRREAPLSTFPDHPIAVALRGNCLSRRWLLPEAGPTPVVPADHGGGATRRQPEGVHCLPAGLSREGLAQAVGVTAAIAGRDGSCVKHVHMMVRRERVGLVGGGRCTEGSGTGRVRAAARSPPWGLGIDGGASGCEPSNAAQL